jgi:hypothetical protein
LARDADLIVVRIADYAVVRITDGRLEVGPDASPDAIATIACRRHLELDGDYDEQQVKGFVESLGYEYVPDREQARDSGVTYRAVS